MGNMTLFIAGIAILSLGTYLMRLGGAKLGNRLAFSERSQALLSDAATVLLFRRPPPLSMRAHISPVWRAFWALLSLCSSRRKVPLIGVIIAAAVVTALLRGGYALGRVSVICKTAVLSGDRAFKPLNNRFDLQRVPLVYRQYRS